MIYHRGHKIKAVDLKLRQAIHSVKVWIRFTRQYLSFYTPLKECQYKNVSELHSSIFNSSSWNSPSLLWEINYARGHYVTKSRNHSKYYDNFFGLSGKIDSIKGSKVGSIRSSNTVITIWWIPSCDSFLTNKLGKNGIKIRFWSVGMVKIEGFIMYYMPENLIFCKYSWIKCYFIFCDHKKRNTLFTAFRPF